MPRQPRLVIAGYPHHLILRGNNRSAIFYNDKDKRFFIKCLKDAKEKTKSKIYAYCLMSNHVHLIVEPSTADGLGNMMQSVGRKYVQYINRAYKRTGTLWEGRFRSSLISKDEYLLTCSKYIELNPVRAKVADNPQGYYWSSFGAKTSSKKDSLLDEDPLYKSLGDTADQRRQNYSGMFVDVISNDKLDMVRLATQKGGVIGGRDFIAKILSLSGRGIVSKARGRPKKRL